MSVSDDYLAFVLEQLAGLGRVSSRRMFGGAGLYHDGIFFGLIDDDALYFKVDDSNRVDFEACGKGPFRPFPDKPEAVMNYYEVPGEVLEDSELLVSWARKALRVALAARATATRSRRRKTHDRQPAGGKGRGAGVRRKRRSRL